MVLNPAAYGHTSIALLDAIQSIAVPVIECHLSNIAAREPFRHTTLTARACRGAISGFGATSYALAIRAAAALLSREAGEMSAQPTEGASPHAPSYVR